MTESDPKDRLAAFAALIGDWSIEATHPALGPSVIGGRARFEWLPGEHFLVQRTEYEHPQLPDAMSVIGRMGMAVAGAERDLSLSMHYYDTRGVHRVYGISFDGCELRTWLDVPGFMQRSSARLTSDGFTLKGEGQLNENDEGFRDDLAFTYRRVS